MADAILGLAWIATIFGLLAIFSALWRLARGPQ